MSEKNYRFADVTFTIRMKNAYVEEQCKDYETDETGIFIEASQEDIEREKMLGEIEVPEGMLESLAIYRKITDIMLDYRTLLFHCSAVAVDGEAYLFAAPSGTGKSTHTRLWREYFGERAVMINDDKPLIQVAEESIYVCGTPWNGKHRLDTNQKVPIRGICILERGKINHIEKITPAEAFPMLYRQTYRSEEREKMIKTLQLLKKMAESVPVYRMQCDISQEAVLTSWKAMSER